MKSLFTLIVSCFFFVSHAVADDFWGYHLILDCKECEVQKVDDPQVIREFVKTLVKEIDMKAYGEPLLEYFAEHIPEAAGYSLVQLIETSAITAHFSSMNGDTYLDIFSCKEFDPEKAKQVVSQFFSPKKMRSTFLCRQA